MSVEKRMEKSIAALARELVQAQAQPGDPTHEKETAYRALCESFPALLRAAGLSQAVTYLEAKGHNKQNEHAALLDHIERQFTGLGLLDRDEILPAKVASPDFPMPRYRYYSYVAFQVAYWHKRLAQALLRQRAKPREEVCA